MAVFWLGSPLPAQNEAALQHEEAEDYYGKWLREDVVYIIADEERAAFNSLTTPEEKEQFIEQFWFRRDPDPRTVDNEFKFEHYRRIAYVNERFGSGEAGWKTDRGRIYIIHGPPAEIESYPTGGTYDRPISEGGGTTATFPFEIWRYRHVSGVGDDILLEFVDPSLSGEYRLALRPEEKDALLHVPGAGATLAEEMGLADKSDRPFFSGRNPSGYPLTSSSSRNNPFYRYDTYTSMQAAPAIQYLDLKELVQVNVSYESLPMVVQDDYFQLNQDRSLVPITLQLDNKDLSFQEEDGNYVARVALYGMVTSISNRLITEFEQDLVTVYSPDQLQAGLQSHSMFQKVLLLDRKQRYKLVLVVRDDRSEKVGTMRKALVPPKCDPESVELSSILLADSMTVLGSVPEREEIFVLGDVKVRPKLGRIFPAGRTVGIYYQIYHVALDQATQKPGLEISYEIRGSGETVANWSDSNGKTIQHFSSQRVVIVDTFDLKGMPPGEYELKIEVTDLLSGRLAESAQSFKVAALEK